VLIDALVQPRASRDAIDGVHDEALKLKVKAPPVDDRANRAVEKLLPDYSSCLARTRRLWEGIRVVANELRSTELSGDG
jgi:uncharacterized protein